MMSKTVKHKSQAKFKNKIIKYDEVDQSTKDMWDRNNYELGQFRHAKNKLEEKIIGKEILKELDELREEQWRKENI